MLKKVLNNKVSILLLILFALGLVLVRAFENQLFYDPFLQFFKYDYQNKPLPAFDKSKLAVGLLFRYVLNMFFSLGIIYLLFKKRQLLKFSTMLFILLFIVLMILFFGTLHFFEQPDYLVLFYVRRFLIQPLFLVLFIPAFYYQQMVR
jgi:exosortase F-associated protein